MVDGEEGLIDRVVTRARIRAFSIAILGVNVAAYALFVARGEFPFDAQGTIILPDFMAHLTGGALVAHGQASHLYDVGAQSAFQTGITGNAAIVDLFLSPPFAALLYAPFAGLSYARGVVAWSVVSLGLLAAGGWFVARLMPSVARDEKRLFFLACAASQPLIQVLGSGQDTGLSLLLWSAGTWLALEKRDGASGAVFALGLFKPQLFVLPPLVFLLSRRWKALAAWAATAAAIGGLTLAVFGVAGVRGWWGILHSPQYVVALRSGRALRMASVIPLFRSLVPASLGSAAASVGGIVSLGIVVATGVRARRAGDERAVWALASVATLLATPHLFDYDLALLALPAALFLELRGAFTPAARDALLALTLLTWTAAARMPLESAPWPARLLAASWAAVPMFILWREVPLARTSATPRRAA